MRDGGASEVVDPAATSRSSPTTCRSFEIVVDVTPDASVARWLHTVVGAGNVVHHDGSMCLSVADQAAMIGVLNGLHDLGLVIERVDRIGQPADQQAAARSS